MKRIISEISEQFYEKIAKNDYFSAFFIDKDFNFIKKHLTEYINYILVSKKEDLDHEQAYLLGVQHSESGIPLNILISFADTIQQKLFKHCKDFPDECIGFNPTNIELVKNALSKGYLHDNIKNADIMSIPLFSVLSTTKIATAIISWISDIHNVLLNESEHSKLLSLDDSCNLLQYIDKPSFNMIFDSEDNFFEFNRMHMELHNSASSLLFFLNEKDYINSYSLYNHFIDQCKTFLNFYFERIVLFEQNSENYFYKYAQDKISNDKEVTFFTINIRNMNMINKIWGYENGDFLVNEVERIVDKLHGMDSENSVYIKTYNAEFIIIIIGRNYSENLESFHSLLYEITNSIPKRGEFNSDVKISSAFLPFGDKSSEYVGHIKEIVHQAISVSKTSANTPMICDNKRLIELDQKVLHDEKIRHFVKQSFNKNNFIPFYQPIIQSKDGKIAHFEALARVCDGETCVSAASFIDYLVETERIIDLDKVMLEKIIDDFPKLKEHVSHIFINISPKSLRAPSYVVKLNEFIINAHAINLEPVCEITEQSLFDNIEVVKEIHARYGTVFAIDDFGSGYSNFSIVSDLAQEGLIKYLKIDGSLIKNIHINIYKENIVTGIVKIAESLELKTVAEFVSDEQTATKLKSIGISHLQGYHYSTPKKLSEF